MLCSHPHPNIEPQRDTSSKVPLRAPKSLSLFVVGALVKSGSVAPFIAQGNRLIPVKVALTVPKKFVRSIHLFRLKCMKV